MLARVGTGGALKALKYPDPPLSNRARQALAVAAALAIAPQLFFIPIWLALPCLMLTIACAWSPPPALPKIWRFALFIVLASSLTMIALYFRRVWGREPGVSLLTVMVAAKLLEVRTSRDAMVVWCAAAVLLVAMTTFDQEFLALGYMLIVLVALFALLDVIHDAHDNHPVGAHVRQAVKRLSLGVPIALVLFVLFPRMASPLWGFSEGKIGRTGLSDSMRMGQISSLVKSDEVAFRVEFQNGSPPAREQLYWRGPVLDTLSVEGTTEVWTTGGHGPGAFVPLPTNARSDDTLRYAVSLQPHQQRWLFALDLPAAYPKGGQLDNTTMLNTAQQLVNRTPIREPVRYEVASTLTAQYTAEPIDAQRNLGTGASTLNPKARQWATETFTKSGDDAGVYVKAVLEHIRGQPFHYTTRPPVLKRDAVDDFWFNSRYGFCEHYAGAFVFLMRAAGVPARVVTGYQGGEINPQNNLLVVRQSDAHAWTEVMVAGQWQRVDPTAAVAPQRIEIDLAAALPAGERNARAQRESMFMKFLDHSWDAVQHNYTNWMLGYDRAQQLRALASIGLSDMQPAQWIGAMLLFSVAAVGLTIGLYTWRERIERSKRGDFAEALWLRFLEKLRKRGVPLPAHTTPRGAQAVLAQSAPKVQKAHFLAVSEFLSQVERVRYAPNAARPTRAQRSALRRAFRRVPFRAF